MVHIDKDAVGFEFLPGLGGPGGVRSKSMILGCKKLRNLQLSFCKYPWIISRSTSPCLT